jgi:hypothetical protein
VVWEQDPEPGFVPPGTLREYYPTGIREAVREAAKELGIAVLGDGLGALARDIVQMFVDFVAADLEDVAAMYPFHEPVRPGACRSAQFHDYMRLRVMACVRVMLQSEATGTDDTGESLGS